MSASSQLVTWGIETQLRCRPGPAIFWIRVSGLLSTGPNFAKLADAFGIAATTVTKRSEVAGAVEAARRLKRAALIDFQVEQEDSVYPMVPAGADLHKMIRRPSPIVETAAD